MQAFAKLLDPVPRALFSRCHLLLVPAVRRVDFSRLVSIPPQLDTDRRKAASRASNWSRYVVRLIRHSGVPILPKVCTRDRSHRRSSMVATPWSKGREPLPPLSVFRDKRRCNMFKSLDIQKDMEVVGLDGNTLVPSTTWRLPTASY